MHDSYSNPDLSQVRPVGVSIHASLMDKDRNVETGELVIAEQPTPAPCMTRLGDSLQCEPSPNAGDFTHVDFDIVSESIRKSPVCLNRERMVRD
jgi:hypothetical protein